MDEVLKVLELDGAAQRLAATLGRGGAAEVVNLALDGVRVTVMPTASSRAERAPIRSRASDSSTWPGRCSTGSGPT